jgi:putative pyrimidine permease RutG
MAAIDKQGYLPRWMLKTEGVIAPDERLPWGRPYS